MKVNGYRQKFAYTFCIICVYFEHKLHFRPYEISSTIYISIKNVDNLNICWYPLTSIALFPNMEVNGYQWLFINILLKKSSLCSTEERNSCRFDQLEGVRENRMMIFFGERSLFK